MNLYAIFSILCLVVGLLIADGRARLSARRARDAEQQLAAMKIKHAEDTDTILSLHTVLCSCVLNLYNVEGCKTEPGALSALIDSALHKSSARLVKSNIPAKHHGN